jgi:Protein of unknown function (DUF4233)
VSDAKAVDPAKPAKRARPPRVRRQRTLTESLLSIVLGLEAVLVFFIALTVFGLHALPPLQAFGGGALLALGLLLGTRVVRYSWGVWFGWALQLVLIATGIVLPALYIAAAFFLAMWIFCFVRARQVDAANARVAQPSVPTEGEQR